MAKILLASAPESVKQRFVEALTPDGHTFVLCDSGDSLRKSLLEGLPDLMIADVDLPSLDALNWSRRSRISVVGGRSHRS